MLKESNGSDLSELEQEFELEMDDLEYEDESSLDEELGDEELEGAGDYEEDLQQEFETTDEENTDYGERFYELAQREYESESEVDREIDGLLNEMEQDFFFGGVKKFLKGKAKGLIKKGLKFAAGKIPALQALQGITQLTRGNLKGLLASLAKAGLAAHPAGAAALPALKALGFEASEDSEANREAWDNYVEVAREAYEHLADNLNETADEPLEASRQATKAYQAALMKQRSGFPRRASYGATLRRGAQSHSRKKRQVVYIDPDVRVVVLRIKR